MFRINFLKNLKINSFRNLHDGPVYKKIQYCYQNYTEKSVSKWSSTVEDLLISFQRYPDNESLKKYIYDIQSNNNSIIYKISADDEYEGKWIKNYLNEILYEIEHNNGPRKGL